MDVESRLAALEKSNRRLKTLLACLLLVAVTVGAVTPIDLSTSKLILSDDGKTLRGAFVWDGEAKESTLLCDKISAKQVLVEEFVAVQQDKQSGRVVLSSDRDGARVYCKPQDDPNVVGDQSGMSAGKGGAGFFIFNRKDEAIWAAP